ncbi:ribonuclease-3 [Catalinimonas alkaloidigena]|uniref:Ribonuclease 3 n=1 Tax=Catalinimonas alkaloidigena TaxID=1075417 RepID=A0A1G8WEM3_9BACT|nr:ribonuclease III [Catalinimonas alkaloidigena]SDJ76691.1 ribonuclease-3 [Catalinimonas alkaloidigena]
MKPILSYLKLYRTQEDRELATAFARIIGRKPLNLDLYKLAIRHASSTVVVETGRNNSNERLEYLGDAILGAIVADYLFKKFPYQDEGFLTEIRSRIVNRESLNQLARKIGLSVLVEFDSRRRSRLSHKSIYGDALEALVGAVYLDQGFKRCQAFVLQRLIGPHFDLDQVVQTNLNFKSRLIEWAQRENQSIRFEIIEESGSQHSREFVAQVVVNDEAISTGNGFSKKKAEQAAAAKACELLSLL